MGIGTGYDFNAVGYSISEGEDQYYLMKMADETMGFSAPVYYEFAAEATASDIKALDVAGSAE
jgi:hypothetical protein